MQFRKYFLIPIVVFFIIFNFCSQVKADMELVNDYIQCNSTSSILTHAACSLSKNLKRRTFSMEFRYIKDIHHFFFDVIIELPRQPKNFVLINISRANGCQLLANENQIALIQMGRSNLDRYSNFPKKCPFLKNVLYYVRGYRYDLKSMPAFSFETKMIVWINFYSDRTKIWQALLKTHIRKKGGNH